VGAVTAFLPLDGKVVVVTGGARGIGRAIVECFTAKGAFTVVADLDVSAATTAASEIGPSARAVSVDVTDEQSVRALMETTVHDLGRIDVLVCNAGGAKMIKPRRSFFEVDRALWDSVVNLNVTSSWLCAKHAFASMREQGGGRIVFVSSASASTALPVGITPYVAAKGAIEALTRGVARECGPYGIGVNAVAPGFTPVESVQRLHGEAETAQLQDEMLARQCRPEVGTAEDVAAMVAFLASAEAKHVTGQIIHVDGGWCLT
jgi:NAD(P)-dependent dehydrogenase (short-subunit alcohol dehydrogenase family)